MKSMSPGTLDGSEYFFHTSSADAKKLFYYLDGCGHVLATPLYEVIREDYNDYLIMAVVSGELQVVNEGQTVHVRPGQTVLLNCHKPHQYRALTQTEFYYVHFDGCNSTEIYQHLMDNAGIVVASESSSEVLDPLKLLYAKFKYGSDISEVEVSGLIHGMLCNLAVPKSKSETQNENSNRVVQAALDYINSHLDSLISVDQLASEVNMSPFYFCRLFKKCTRYSPHEYILTKRLDLAKYLLTSTNQTISEIAHAVGFNSDTGFINAFKGRVGISPGKFRTYHPK